MSNRAINHIGIHVPDLDAAVKWYTKHFGFKQIRSNMSFDRTAMPSATIFRIYGNKLHKVEVAFLSASNDVGFELFQFIDPPMSEPSSFEYTRGGVFHIAVTDPDPVAVLERVVQAGGKLIGEPVEIPRGEGHEKMVALYLQDPWGNVIEHGRSVGLIELIIAIAMLSLVFTAIALSIGIDKRIRNYPAVSLLG
ncbi:hypothetical protein N0V90_010483 [Kalmusia sp. IMI 367209]|nr:hypothetical protein N0V90_010483 [Kalmusia sp. IMI 367209]